jgi:hypothetical protein
MPTKDIRDSIHQQGHEAIRLIVSDILKNVTFHLYTTCSKKFSKKIDNSPAPILREIAS